AHFRNVETFKLRLRRHALTHHPVNHEIEDKAQRKDEANERGDAHELCNELAAVPIEQASHRPGHTVPRTSVITLAVRKQSDRNHTPKAVCTVYGDRAHG